MAEMDRRLPRRHRASPSTSLDKVVGNMIKPMCLVGYVELYHGRQLLSRGDQGICASRMWNENAGLTVSVSRHECWPSYFAR